MRLFVWWVLYTAHVRRLANYNTVHAFCTCQAPVGPVLHYILGLDCIVELHLYLKRDMLQGKRWPFWRRTPIGRDILQPSNTHTEIQVLTNASRCHTCFQNIRPIDVHSHTPTVLYVHHWNFSQDIPHRPSSYRSSCLPLCWRHLVIKGYYVSHTPFVLFWIKKSSFVGRTSCILHKNTEGRI